MMFAKQRSWTVKVLKAPLLQYQHLIRVLYGIESVCDSDHSALIKLLLNEGLDLGVGHFINIAGGFVQHQNL